MNALLLCLAFNASTLKEFLDAADKNNVDVKLSANQRSVAETTKVQHWTALLPALFAAIAPPGSARIPMTIGAITFAVTAISAIAAWSARETSRVRLEDLGNPNAVPAAERDYRRRRVQAGRAESR